MITPEDWDECEEKGDDFLLYTVLLEFFTLVYTRFIYKKHTILKNNLIRVFKITLTSLREVFQKQEEVTSYMLRPMHS